MVGAGVVALGDGVVGDGRELDQSGGDGGDRVAEGVADQEVVDQLTAPAGDPGVTLGFGDQTGEVPQSGPTQESGWS